MTPESGCTYGIQEGMVIRNTFLEFADVPNLMGGEPAVFLAGSADLTEAQRHLLPQPRAGCRVRARSCPLELLSGEVEARKDNESLDTTRSSSAHAEGADQSSPQGTSGPMETIDVSESQEEWQEAQQSGRGGKWQRWEERPEDASQWTPSTGGFGQGSMQGGGRGKKGSQQLNVKPTSQHQTLLLRGLPFNITERELWHFLENSGVGREQLADEGAVALLSNAQGRPSGFAEVSLAVNADFVAVRERLHMKRLGGRYIEALPPRAGKKRQAAGGRGGSWRR